MIAPPSALLGTTVLIISFIMQMKLKVDQCINFVEGLCFSAFVFKFIFYNRLYFPLTMLFSLLFTFSFVI